MRWCLAWWRYENALLAIANLVRGGGSCEGERNLHHGRNARRRAKPAFIGGGPSLLISPSSMRLAPAYTRGFLKLLHVFAQDDLRGLKTFEHQLHHAFAPAHALGYPPAAAIRVR